MHVVKVGDLWEAEDRLFWIVGLRPSVMPGHSIYEYFEITAEEFALQRGHLTIERHDLFLTGRAIADLWKKIA